MARNKYAEAVARGVYEMLETEPDFRVPRSQLTSELQKCRAYLGYDEDDCSTRKCQDMLYQMIRINHLDIREIESGNGRCFVGIGFKHDIENYLEKQSEFEKELAALYVKQEEEARLLKEKRQREIEEEKQIYEKNLKEARQRWEHWVNIDRPLFEEAGFKVKTLSQDHFIDSDGNKEIVSEPNYPRVPPSFASDKKKREYSRMYLKYLNLKKERYGEESLTDRQKAKLAQRVS